MNFTPLQKLPKNVGDLVKLIVATGFKWLSKVQKIAQPGHTGLDCEIRGKLLGWTIIWSFKVF